MRVPLGVRLRNHDGEVLCEIKNHMEMVKILDGGKSGRGLRKTLKGPFVKFFFWIYFAFTTYLKVSLGLQEHAREKIFEKY